MMARIWPFAAVLVACADEAPPGAVEVGWRFAGRTCESLGLTEVEAALYDFSSAAPVVSARSPCDEHELLLPTVDRGRYALVLHGIEADGCVTHAARNDNVRVFSRQTTALPELLLARRSRTLEVSWPFAHGGNCADNEVTQVVMVVYVNGVVERTLPALCGESPVRVPAVPSGTLRLQIRGIDGLGTAIATGVAEDLDPTSACDDVVSVEVPLELCLEPGC